MVKVNNVHDFYYHNDISYNMPVMKDCMVVWEDGKKMKKSKHYMFMFIKEAYALYKEE